MRDHSWPITLSGSEIYLAPLRLRDRKKWLRVRAENREWLAPWEATLPYIPGSDAESLRKELPSFFRLVRTLNRESRDVRSISFAIWSGNNLIGQISMGGIILGALRGAHIGYWIDRSYAGRGYTTQAVNLLTEYGFSVLALHRIEINLRPENAASRRVAEKAGYVFEGVRPRYLHIDGDWRDHISFVKENPLIK
jgi:[ribosomal protein S5]-alanine N-acetyltransferase